MDFQDELKITSTSTALQNYEVPNIGTVLVLGNERRGISHEVLAMLDENLQITMLGKNSSMNVSHASAIALYELTKPKPHEFQI